MTGIRRIIGNQDDRIQGVYVNVFDKDDDEDEEIRYCASCIKNGYLRKLKSRLYLDEKGKALAPEPDAELAAVLDLWRYRKGK